MVIELLFLTLVSLTTSRVSYNSDILAKNLCITPIYDVWHNNISNYIIFLGELWWLPDVTLLINMLGIMALDYNQLELFIYQLSILYTIRLFACGSTIGYVSPRYVITNNNYGILNNYCTDLYISGHTLTATLMWCFMMDINHDLLAIITLTVVCLISIISNLIIGDHYTADVIVGIALPILLHW